MVVFETYNYIADPFLGFQGMLLHKVLEGVGGARDGTQGLAKEEKYSH